MPLPLPSQSFKEEIRKRIAATTSGRTASLLCFPTFADNSCSSARVKSRRKKTSSAGHHKARTVATKNRRTVATKPELGSSAHTCHAKAVLLAVAVGRKRLSSTHRLWTHVDIQYRP